MQCIVVSLVEVLKRIVNIELQHRDTKPQLQGQPGLALAKSFCQILLFLKTSIYFVINQNTANKLHMYRYNICIYINGAELSCHV